MKDKLKKIEKKFQAEVSEVKTEVELEALRVKYLGRKGTISMLMRRIGTVPKKKRPEVGKLINELKKKAEDLIQARQAAFVPPTKALKIDVTLPGVCRDVGHIHLLTKMIKEISDVFVTMGFRIVEGPEIETEYYNFEALNIPKDHPSRETFHTFYISTDPLAAGRKNERFLLRSQTSTVQIRIMEKEKPPLRVIAPGKVFRPDATDASHSFMFHQIEGLMVDRKVRFSDLKGVLAVFVREVFGAQTQMRFRPHFFPFTEPSAEVDISCIICKQRGCRVCSYKGWLEILGAGMVDPEVFKAVGYGEEEFRGFAFGMGIERIAMLKYGVEDIRLFFENDLRFLKQF
jgi:phenylalanyl-tRNA synthetase alpha chain